MPEQTDTDTIYVLSENAPTQIDSMVGLAEQVNLPPGYSRTRLEPTPSQGVWRVERTRRFNVEPLALSQADVTYDKTQASTTTLAAATGGEMPITYSLPLLRGSQDRYDVPGAPVTFDPVTRELNIGSGFDEGIEVNYTARDACNQVANARVIIRPTGTVLNPAFAGSTFNSQVDYNQSSGAGHVSIGRLNFQTGGGNQVGLPPYDIEFLNSNVTDAGWEVSTFRDTTRPTVLGINVTFGSWIFEEDTTFRQIPLQITDFFGNSASGAFLIRYTRTR